MMGFKVFHSAQATIAGIETVHMIRKGQLSEDFTFLWCILKGSVATVVGSEERGVFRHNYLLKP
jgi:hypothetical protein